MDLKLLSKELLDELESIQMEQLCVIRQSDLSIVLCRNLLSRYKKSIIRSKFENVDSEILFFKETKQVPLSNLICFSELRSFEIQFPKGNRIVQKQTIVKKISKLNRFFRYNMDFVQYIEQERMYLDGHYFTRAYFNNFNATHSKYYYCDPEFSSSHDILLAKMNANKRLVKYLDERLKNINHRNTTRVNNAVRAFKWTSSKAALVELIYALNYNRAINNGNAELKKIVTLFQEIFNFDLGEFYKIYSEIKSRRKSRTKFLDELSEGLISRMDKEGE